MSASLTYTWTEGGVTTAAAAPGGAFTPSPAVWYVDVGVEPAEHGILRRFFALVLRHDPPPVPTSPPAGLVVRTHALRPPLFNFDGEASNTQSAPTDARNLGFQSPGMAGLYLRSVDATLVTDPPTPGTYALGTSTRCQVYGLTAPYPYGTPPPPAGVMFTAVRPVTGSFTVSAASATLLSGSLALSWQAWPRRGWSQDPATGAYSDADMSSEGATWLLTLTGTFTDLPRAAGWGE